MIDLIWPNYFYIIWFAALLGAIVSAVVGMIGGTLLLAVMAQYLKMEVLIPIHGSIQLSSNMARAWFLRPFINWRITGENLAGIVLGSIFGSTYVVKFPEKYFSLGIGLFIILITLMPKLKTPIPAKGRWILLGFVASFMSLFIGAVGVVVGAVFVAAQIPKKEMIATQAMCQGLVHAAKVLVFVSLGFLLKEWAILIVGGIGMTFTGSWLGTRILEYIPEKLFRRILTTLIVILGARLIWVGAAEIWGLNFVW